MASFVKQMFLAAGKNLYAVCAEAFGDPHLFYSQSDEARQQGEEENANDWLVTREESPYHCALQRIDGVQGDHFRVVARGTSDGGCHDTHPRPNSGAALTRAEEERHRKRYAERVEMARTEMREFNAEMRKRKLDYLRTPYDTSEGSKRRRTDWNFLIPGRTCLYSKLSSAQSSDCEKWVGPASGGCGGGIGGGVIPPIRRKPRVAYGVGRRKQKAKCLAAKRDVAEAPAPRPRRVGLCVFKVARSTKRKRPATGDAQKNEPARDAQEQCAKKRKRTMLVERDFVLT